jgi:hypothetical protein
MAGYSRNLEEAEAPAVSRRGRCDIPGNASLARQVVQNSEPVKKYPVSLLVPVKYPSFHHDDAPDDRRP